jgi:hypothetical protein
VVSYACSAIHVGPYVPGDPLEVSVDVHNSGGGDSDVIATVVVYWADPTVGFAKPNFLAATTVTVPPNPISPASATTKKMMPVIPATAPEHACLVVYVSHPYDKAGTVCDPINDRHWAQRNLVAAHAAVGAPVIMPLTAANPFAQGGNFEVSLGPADERRAQIVAREFQTEPGDVPVRLRLLNEDGTAASEEGRLVRVPVQLGALERRRFQIMIEFDSDLPAGRSTSVEAFLLDISRDRRPVGSLGVILLPP